MAVRILPWSAALLVLAATACADPPSTDDGGETSETGSDGDGDGDGEPSDHEGWCEVCANPPDGSACGAQDGFDQYAWISGPPSEDPYDFEYEVDEQCTALSVSPSSVELACETFNPSIVINVDGGWTPNFQVGDAMHLVAAKQDNGQPWTTAWQLHRADSSLAIAGVDAYSQITHVGLDALAVTPVTGLCAPECEGEPYQQTATEQVGIAVEVEGEAATLFAGDHAVLGNLELWVGLAWQVTCDQPNAGPDRFHVFLSAVDTGS